MKSDLLWVTPFHLAILARQAEIIQTMLEFILLIGDYEDDLDQEKMILKLFSQTTKVEFLNGEPETYFKDDQIMDGINSIHLAARYHAQSLLLMVQLVYDVIGLGSSVMAIFEAVEPHLGKTPLHLATMCPNHTCIKILLTCGVDIEATDIRGYTALHMAAREGFESHCKILLDHGADPNVFGNDPDHYKTPLHRATSQKVVQLLVKHGADANAITKDSNGKIYKSVIDVFLSKQPGAVEEILNSCISTNGQELDSTELQIIYTLDVFFKEGLMISGEEEESSNILNTLMISQVLENVKETALLNKIVTSKQSSLLMHPVAAAYLHFKWKLIRNWIYFNVLLHFIFLLILTAFGIISTEMLKCGNMNATGITLQKFTLDEKLQFRLLPNFFYSMDL